MDILEEIGSIRPQSLMADDRTSPSSLDMKEINSYVVEKTPKVRKPYTITKQRERWTEEEHNKFLEALQLYGRGWRRIEEHIGTKTAVQIRSHAQKFFSKVARESTSGDRSEILKTIEIPPPRPKKRPSHPYPRKFGNSPSQSIKLLKQFGSRSSFDPSMSEQGEGSPTSVLSAVGSDDLSTSFFQSSKDVFSTPGKYVSGSISPVNGSQSPVSTIQGTNMPTPTCLTIGDKPMETYNLLGEKMTSQEISSAEVATIKLFGKTLPLIPPKRTSPSDVSCVGKNIEAPYPIKADAQHVQGATDQHEPISPTMQMCNHAPFSSNPVGNLRNSYSGGTPLQPYYFDLPGHNSTNTIASHPPWWCISQTWPFAAMNPQSISPGTYPPVFGAMTMSSHETQSEGSWTGSSNTCHNGVTVGTTVVDVVHSSKETDNLNKNEPPHCSKLKSADTSAFRSWKLGLHEPINCLPRKRCAAESEAQSIAAIEDGEGPTIRLCL